MLRLMERASKRTASTKRVAPPERDWGWSLGEEGDDEEAEKNEEERLEGGGKTRDRRVSEAAPGTG